MDKDGGLYNEKGPQEEKEYAIDLIIKLFCLIYLICW